MFAMSFNGHECASGIIGLRNVIRRMNDNNSIKVHATVNYVTSTGKVSTSRIPCEIVCWNMCDKPHVMLYGEGMLAEYIVDLLRGLEMCGYLTYCWDTTGYENPYGYVEY